jgi:hypothetical protein
MSQQQQQQQQQLKHSVTSFYRRPLPSNAIDFASNEGKIIFREAMEQGRSLHFIYKLCLN